MGGLYPRNVQYQMRIYPREGIYGPPTLRSQELFGVIRNVFMIWCWRLFWLRAPYSSGCLLAIGLWYNNVQVHMSRYCDTLPLPFPSDPIFLWNYSLIFFPEQKIIVLPILWYLVKNFRKRSVHVSHYITEVVYACCNIVMKLFVFSSVSCFSN
jgi:hypothetical protein